MHDVTASRALISRAAIAAAILLRPSARSRRSSPRPILVRIQAHPGLPTARLCYSGRSLAEPHRRASPSAGSSTRPTRSRRRKRGLRRVRVGRRLAAAYASATRSHRGSKARTSRRPARSARCTPPATRRSVSPGVPRRRPRRSRATRSSASAARSCAASREAGPVDGVYLDLHGAMVAEHVDDGEGELLARVRRVVGPRVPVVASLDLHANVTRAMVERSDGARRVPHLSARRHGRDRRARRARCSIDLLRARRRRSRRACARSTS